MRLTALLLDHAAAATPATHALAALMSLNAARLPGRLDSAGDLSPLLDQDRSRWDARLVAQGLAHLDRSAVGDEVSTYHLEAAIAATHASAAKLDQTDWGSIVALYDRLMAIAPSPVVALNRAIAVAQRDGPERGIEEIRAIQDRERLDGYPFYPAALGELELRRGDREVAREHFAAALVLARNPAERRFLDKRMAACESASDSDRDRGLSTIE
jgi:RNA polymerase sigma-70 factor (ECF subfamily)